MGYRQLTPDELDQLLEGRFGKETADTIALEEMIADFLDKFQSDLVKQDKDNVIDIQGLKHYTEGAKHAAKQLALFAGGKIDRASFKYIVEMYSGIFSDGFMIGSIAGRDLARHVVRAPLSRGGSEGGTQSGIKRRANRAKTWEPVAKRLALESYARDPGKSRDDLAADVAALWTSEIKCVGHYTLINLLKRMEGKELPVRTRKKRVEVSKGLQ